MQCATMNHRRKLTMNWDGLRDDDDEAERFFESRERMSSVAPPDMESDPDDFEDSRTSFSSTISSASSDSNISIDTRALGGYDMWMAEPGDIKERRRRLLQGMGLASTKCMLRKASTKIARTVSKKRDNGRVATPEVPPPPPPVPVPVISAPKVEKVDSCPAKESRNDEPLSLLPPHPTAKVFGRSRSDSDIDAFSASTKQRKEELIGQVSKQRLTRTSSEIVVPTIGVQSSAVRMSLGRARDRNSKALHSAEPDGSFDPVFLIKNLDTGKEFVVKEYNEQGMWNKLSDVQTGKQLTIDEFEKSVGHSRLVKELMRRQKRENAQDGRKFNQNKYLTKSFKNSKKKGAALLKNIKVAASSKSLSLKEHSNSSSEEQSGNKAPSQWVKVRQHGKSYKEFTALHLSQEIQAHEGSIWVIRFSSDARFLASAGEDKVIHIWEVQECEISSTRPTDDLNSASSTPVHPIASIASDHPTLSEVTPTPSKKKGKSIKKKAISIPDYVNMPETGFALSEKPICTFEGHQDEVLDLSWSTSQILLSSSMDKTVRMWDLESKSCLKIFTHNDYVTCIQFNPVDDNYFISGSLDAKVRIWNIPERQVVDWTDVHEMVTAASYTPDGQGAVIGSHQGICRFYSIDDYKLEQTKDIQMKTKAETKKLPGFHPQLQAKKITGFQFAPWNPSEVLITSTDSRIRIFNGEELITKFRGFRNTNSQISASFSPDGKHVISASEDSQVYIWTVPNPIGGKKSKCTVQAYEHFQCKDLTVAIAWPGSTSNEPPVVVMHSKRYSRRSTSSLPNVKGNSPTHEDNVVGASKRRNLPPLPKKNVTSESIANCEDIDVAHSLPRDPGIGVSNSSGSFSASLSNHESSSASAASPSPSLCPRSYSNDGGGYGGHTVQATAWGMVIITASLEGEIRVHQNFGLPRKVRFRD